MQAEFDGGHRHFQKSGDLPVGELVDVEEGDGGALGLGQGADGCRYPGLSLSIFDDFVGELVRPCRPTDKLRGYPL